MRSGQAKTPTDQKSRPALGEGLVQVLFLVAVTAAMTGWLYFLFRVLTSVAAWLLA
ncbi:hypothetical protein SAMN05192541_1781 [Bradyrhizobium arachidis]|nr:hypothetical protein SAMN05192541_1781 [Bradyrhizobium arachidis]